MKDKFQMNMKTLDEMENIEVSSYDKRIKKTEEIRKVELS